MEIGDLVEITRGKNQGKTVIVVGWSKTTYTIACARGIILKNGGTDSIAKISKQDVRRIRSGRNLNVTNLRLVKS